MGGPSASECVTARGPQSAVEGRRILWVWDYSGFKNCFIFLNIHEGICTATLFQVLRRFSSAGFQ
jgi:hypothetical protein